jgi:superfamily II DNA or RNA helicase
MIVADEVHGVKSSNEISKLIKGVDIPYKFGCTGTLPKDVKDQWNIAGIFGPILDELEIETLQSKNILANVHLQPIKFCHSKKENFKKTHDEYGKEIEPFEAAQREYQYESQYLGEYKETNKKIVDLAKGLITKKPEWNVIVLFDYISQGQQLYSLSDASNKFYIDGSIPVDKRQEIVSIMDNSGGNILFGNCKCIGIGLTVKRVNVIILCIIGSSSTKTIQAIGRGMQKKSDKSTVHVFDILHNYKYSQKHFKERSLNYLKYYKLQEDKDYKVKEIII